MKRAAALSILLTILFFFPVITGHYIKSGDLYDEYLPVKQAVRDAFAGRGSLVHETSIGLGFPIYRDIQSGLYYPLNLIFLLPVNIYVLMQIALLLNILLLSFGAYILMRKFTDSPSALLFSAVAAFNGYILGHATHYSFLCSMAMLPYHIFFITEYIRKEGRGRYILSIVTLLLVLSGGHPQVFLYCAITDLMLILLLKASIRQKARGLSILLFTALLSAPITLPLLKLAEGSYRLKSAQEAVNMGIKRALLLFFPSVLSGGGGFAEESYFYPSVILLFAAMHFVFSSAGKRSHKGLRFWLIPLLFLILSLTGFTLFGSFTSTLRSFGFFVLSSSFLLLAGSGGFLEDRRSALTALIIVFTASLILLLRGNGFADSFKTFLFAFLMFILIFIGRERLKSAFYPLLILLAAADLFAANFSVNTFSAPKYIEHISIPDIEGRRTVTLLPSGYEFHEEYIKDYMHTDDLRDIERYSTLGDRGVYYNAVSLNIYNTLTYAKYIEFFADEKILQGGVSNLQYIFNPIYVDYEYVLVPDIPFTAEIKGSLMIPFDSSFADTFELLFTGELKTPNDLVSRTGEKGGLDYKKIFIDGPLLIEGSGFIYLATRAGGADIVRFPYVFEKSGFERRNENPFSLFRRNGYEEDGLKLVASPVDGSFVDEKRMRYVPMDLLVGFLIALSGIMLIVSFVRKEIK